ncbi:hypothetical protein GCM10018965_010220 [Nonomuraea roseola]
MVVPPGPHRRLNSEPDLLINEADATLDNAYGLDLLSFGFGEAVGAGGAEDLG